MHLSATSADRPYGNETTAVNGWFMSSSLAVFVFINGAFIALLGRGYGISLARKYGVLESAQSALLAIAFVVFALGWRETECDAGRGAGWTSRNSTGRSDTTG